VAFLGTKWVSPVPSAEGIDLLDKLMVYDHDVRLTEQQAISYASFDPVHDRVTAETRRAAERFDRQVKVRLICFKHVVSICLKHELRSGLK
jgi:hypothetical protein